MTAVQNHYGVPHLNTRLDAGSEVPSGECPVSLVYPVYPVKQKEHQPMIEKRFYLDMPNAEETIEVQALQTEPDNGGEEAVIIIDVDKSHNGPRIWVSVFSDEVRVLIHPNDGDPVHAVTLDRTDKHCRSGGIMKTIRQRLNDHLQSGGTINDSTTDELFRKQFRIPESEDTDLEEVERWAVYGTRKLKDVRKP